MAVTPTYGNINAALPYSQPGPTERGRRSQVRTLTLSGTYATGGFTITNQKFGVRNAQLVMFHGPFRNGTNILWPAYDYTNAKIMLFNGDGGVAGPGAEVANGTSVASYVGVVEVEGY
jgi:hypothetical protein